MSNLEKNTESLAGRLKLARTLLMMNQQDFAEKLGVHKNTIGKWERGDAVPDLSSATVLCSNLGLSPYWLLNGEGPMLDKDRETKMTAGPGTKLKEMLPYKLSEVRGTPEFDATMARLEAKWKEIAQALPEDREDADMEKAYLYHQVQQLEAALAEARAEVLKAKDEAIKAQSIALQMMQTVGTKGTQKLSLQVLEDLRNQGGYQDIPSLIRALSKTFLESGGMDDEPPTDIMQKILPPMRSK